MQSSKIPLNLPPIEGRISEDNGKTLIYDELRGKKIVLTPEEHVRQRFVNFLITVKNFPPERIANEVSINVNNTSKRCDTVVYDNYLDPLVIVEYKAPDVPITKAVFEQIARYNLALRAPYLIVSNGLTHYCCHIDYVSMSYSFLKDIPLFEEISRDQAQ
ncbi:MAG: type I restriction enzyme HsdR N-terminal domain-containing protein [Tannerella sp.]|jgi:hypothetical protein|nr:type I restriction enzyme HsdR N-terminal domain-containing protein [Tannerella sp.]